MDDRDVYVMEVKSEITALAKKYKIDVCHSVNWNLPVGSRVYIIDHPERGLEVVSVEKDFPAKANKLAKYKILGLGYVLVSRLHVAIVGWTDGENV